MQNTSLLFIGGVVVAEYVTAVYRWTDGGHSGGGVRTTSSGGVGSHALRGIRPQVVTYAHAYTQVHTLTCIFTHAHIQTRIHRHTRADTRTHIYTYMHAVSYTHLTLPTSVYV